jgi:3-deoxy-7-phosphoheptulonate synthase
LHCEALGLAEFQGFFCFWTQPLAACGFAVDCYAASGWRENPMIVVMQPGAAQQQIDHVIERIEQLGLRSHVIVGTERTVIAALGEKRDGAKQALETGEGVERVVPILAPFKIASTEVKKERTVVTSLGLTVGGKSIGVIAGPCSVESRQQILEVAHIVKEAGATGLRGGAFKPRTSPYSFQGLKETGLQLMAVARDETGLAIVTEVMAPEHVPLVAEYADILQVGARNMQNYPLLETVGESGLPVLLKRGPSATMEEFLLAAEYILKTGNTQVMLCERGIRTFEDHTRFTLPLATVPYLHQTTHLPVVVDPSHGTGKASLVATMARAAVAAGADGLIVEVHPEPEKALSDGFQALTPVAFRQMMAECRKVAVAVGREM